MKGSKTLLSYLLFIVGLQWKSVAALPVCHDDEFQCKNGKCISFSSVCDATDDCGDNSDEERCVAEKKDIRCESNQFRCKNQLCISVARLCDGYDDCGDLSDESPTGGAKCLSIKCRNEDDFRCKIKPMCISRYYRCDGTFDCEDQSDESNCESVICKSNEFQCANKKRCISNDMRCDFRYDCDDKSDEVKCNNTTCPSGSFACQGSSHCLSNTLKCNGAKNCPDGSDELNCPKFTGKCNANQFKCLSNGLCIDKAYRCDTVDDCSDSSDEMDCSKNKCAKDQFRCDSGQCVSNVFCRDGEYHCRDKSDELKCKRRKRRDAAKSKPKAGSLVLMPQANETVIPKNPCEGQTESFFCPSAVGTDNQCITKSWLCDGENDCPDGIDELNSTCESVQCQENEFKCANGKCEKKKQVCDGIDDCGDNSDEDYALCHPTVAPVSCKNDSYQCMNESKCIPIRAVCNDVVDCLGGDDERDLCDKKECENENGGCSHKCEELKLGYKCLCPQGFKLDLDNKTCVDIDECKEGWDLSKCSQLCLNLNGSYKCSCQKGYNLDQANRKCRAEGIVPDLVFANKLDVRIIQSNSQHYQKFVDANQANAVAVDVFSEMVYWSDMEKGTISCASRTDLISPKVIITGLKKPRSLAVDWIGRKLYWIDTGFNNISVSNLDGSFPKTLVQGTDLEEFCDLAIHPSQGFLFWTDVAKKSKIERSNLLGSSRKVIVSDQDMPMGITVDTVSDKIYWSDMHLHHICSVNLDGSDFKRVLNNIASPLSVAVFEDEIYWTSKVENKIYRANKFDGTEKSEYNASFLSPMDVVVYHSLAQVHSPHPCNNNNGGCSHLCLVQSSTSAICACPDTMMHGINKRTCVPLPVTPTDLITTETLVETTQVPFCNGYQCHSSNKCIEKKLMCDGVPHCPEHDDETSCKQYYIPVSNKDDQISTTSGNKSFIIGAALGGVFLLLLFFVVFIYLFRKKKNRFDLSMVYETESNIVHGKDGYDKELKFVVPNQTADIKQGWVSKKKVVTEDSVYDEAKVPLNEENDDPNCSEDSSSGEMCFEDDRQPIMTNIV